MNTLYWVMLGLFAFYMTTVYVQTRSVQVLVHSALRLAGYMLIMLIVYLLYNAYVQRLGYCPLGTLNPIVLVTALGAAAAWLLMSLFYAHIPRLFQTEKGMYLLGWNDEMITRTKYRSIARENDTHYVLTAHDERLRPKKLWLPRRGEPIYQKLKQYLEEA